MEKENLEKLLDKIKEMIDWKPEYEIGIKSVEENGKQGCALTVVGRGRDILFGFSRLCAELIVECDFEPEDIQKAMQIGIDSLKLKNKE